jgi:hypothetical protein
MRAWPCGRLPSARHPKLESAPARFSGSEPGAHAPAPPSGPGGLAALRVRASPPATSVGQPACRGAGLARAAGATGNKGGQLPQLRCGPGAGRRRLDSPAGPAASWLQARGQAAQAAAATRVHRRKGNDRKPESGFTGMLRTCATAHLTIPPCEPASGGRLNSDAIMSDPSTPPAYRSAKCAFCALALRPTSLLHRLRTLELLESGTQVSHFNPVCPCKLPR